MANLLQAEFSRLWERELRHTNKPDELLVCLADLVRPHRSADDNQSAVPQPARRSGPPVGNFRGGWIPNASQQHANRPATGSTNYRNEMDKDVGDARQALIPLRSADNLQNPIATQVLNRGHNGNRGTAPSMLISNRQDRNTSRDPPIGRFSNRANVPSSFAPVHQQSRTNTQHPQVNNSQYRGNMLSSFTGYRQVTSNNQYSNTGDPQLRANAPLSFSAGNHQSRINTQNHYVGNPQYNANAPSFSTGNRHNINNTQYFNAGNPRHRTGTQLIFTENRPNTMNNYSSYGGNRGPSAPVMFPDNRRGPISAHFNHPQHHPQRAPTATMGGSNHQVPSAPPVMSAGNRGDTRSGNFTNAQNHARRAPTAPMVNSNRPVPFTAPVQNQAGSYPTTDELNRRPWVWNLHPL